MARKPMKPPEDLAELDTIVQSHEEGRVIPLLNMDGVSPLGFGIRIAGPESAQFQAAQDQMQREVLTLSLQDESMSDSDRKKSELRFLSRICMAFEGRAMLDKTELQNTEEDFYKLFARLGFIARQIDRAQARRVDFLPDTETISSGT